MHVTITTNGRPATEKKTRQFFYFYFQLINCKLDFGVTANKANKMWEELKTRTVKLEKFDRDGLMIVGHLQSIPRMKIMKTKWAKTTPSSRKTLTGETSRNIKRVFVNLMPILAAAREPVEEEESTDEEEEEDGSANEKKMETSSRNQPPFIDFAKEQVSGPEVELPPISAQKAAAPQGDCQTRGQAALPPIRPRNKPAGSSREPAGSKRATEQPAFSVTKKAQHNFEIAQM